MINAMFGITMGTLLNAGHLKHEYVNKTLGCNNWLSNA